MKRGRKSANELGLVCIDAGRKRLDTPAYLKPQEAAIFRELVDSCAAQHFVRSDVPLLVAYATAIHLSRWAADQIDSDNGMMAIWEKATRTVAMLATRLRLAPQARSDPKTVARARADDGKPKPWE